jgi:hypothetical protein
VLPLVMLQATPAVNHPFLPIGLSVTTSGLAVAGLLLAIVPALALRCRPVPAWAAKPLVVAPVAVIAGAGLVPSSMLGGSGPAEAALAGLPFAVVCLALLRRHRPRRPGRTVVVWATLTAAAVPGTVLVTFGGAILLGFVHDLVFAVDGGYSSEVLSFVPGMAALMLPPWPPWPRPAPTAPPARSGGPVRYWIPALYRHPPSAGRPVAGW